MQQTFDEGMRDVTVSVSQGNIPLVWGIHLLRKMRIAGAPGLQTEP